MKQKKIRSFNYHIEFVIITYMKKIKRFKNNGPGEPVTVHHNRFFPHPFDPNES